MIFNEENCFQIYTKWPIHSILHRSATTNTGNTTKEEHAVEEEKPVVFTKSKGFKTTPTYLNPNHAEDSHPFRNISISFSLACFCLYFFVLREENDIDELIYDRAGLYDRIQGLEKVNLIASIR